MEEIYLVMAKTRVRGTENWNNPYVVIANKTKEASEKDADRWNRENKKGEYLETFYYVKKINLYY